MQLKLITRKSIELAFATFLAGGIGQFILDPALDINTSSVKKLIGAGVLAVAMFVKGRLGEFIGSDPNSTAWLGKKP